MAADERAPRCHRAGRASTTSRSSPPTWTRPCGSTSGVLGMRLAATTMAGPMRHYFFEMGRGNTVAFFEVEGRRDVRQARRRPERPRHPARPHLVRRPRRARARDAAQAAARGRLRGHDGRRPRLHPLRLLHRPQRHRARGVVVGRRRHRPADRLQRRCALRRPRPGAGGRRAARPAASTTSPSHRSVT